MGRCGASAGWRRHCCRSPWPPGSRSAPALTIGSSAASLTLLGRFELRRDGNSVALPPGRPAKALRAVAAAGGRMHAEELIETLWPGWTRSGAATGCVTC